MVIDSDPSQGGIESTIIKVEDEMIYILRPGLITSHDLQNCVGRGYKIESGKTAFESNQDIKQIEVPGQSIAHYRPEYPLSYKITNRPVEYWQEQLSDCEFKVLSVDPLITARELYTHMRSPLKKDSQGEMKKKCFLIPEEINLLSEREQEVWQGILNRLKKAATF